MDQPAEEGAGGDDDGASRQIATIRKPNADDAVVGDNQLVGLAFDHVEVYGRADGGLHGGCIELPVRLGTGAAHRGPLAPIEHPKLNSAGIGDEAHQAVQRVDFPDQMPLAESPDGRIAGHRADRRKAVGHQDGLCAHTCGGTGSLATRVASTDDDDVK